MQLVGKFQAVARGGEELAANAVATIEEWAQGKFQQDESGYSIVRASGVEALFNKSQHEFEGNRLTRFEVLEPIPGGHLHTVARILSKAEKVYLNCTLGIGAEGGLAPPTIDLHAPRFIRNVIGSSASWQFSPDVENLIDRFINIGLDDVDAFLALLQTRLRRLPLIVVSEFDGRTIAGNMHTRTAADLCGLGHVCRINGEASWAITERLGREWSVYNGAVRLFWPFRANTENPWNHPLWTYDALTRRGNSEDEIRDWLRRQLRERLLDASTFLADDPAFAAFERGLERARRDETRRTAPASEHFDQEIRALRAELDAKDQELETLRNNVEALTIALRSQAAPQPIEVHTEDVPPATVADAVAVSRRKHAGRLVFGDAIDEQVAALSPGAGPPEKVLRYLDSLAELSTALEAGSLGKSVPLWLRDSNVEASGESDTTKKNRDARRARTFRFGGDEELYCEFHAKPSDGVSPDQCVRIYFAIADAPPRVRIGYVGRHFD